MVWLILRVVSVCLAVTLVYCGYMPKWIKLVFGVRITTEDSQYGQLLCNRRRSASAHEDGALDFSTGYSQF